MRNLCILLLLLTITSPLRAEMEGVTKESLSFRGRAYDVKQDPMRVMLGTHGEPFVTVAEESLEWETHTLELDSPLVDARLIGSDSVLVAVQQGLVLWNFHTDKSEFIFDLEFFSPGYRVKSLFHFPDGSVWMLSAIREGEPTQHFVFDASLQPIAMKHIGSNGAALVGGASEVIAVDGNSVSRWDYASDHVSNESFPWAGNVLRRPMPQNVGNPLMYSGHERTYMVNWCDFSNCYCTNYLEQTMMIQDYETQLQTWLHVFTSGAACDPHVPFPQFGDPVPTQSHSGNYVWVEGAYVDLRSNAEYPFPNRFNYISGHAFDDEENFIVGCFQEKDHLMTPGFEFGGLYKVDVSTSETTALCPALVTDDSFNATEANGSYFVSSGKKITTWEVGKMPVPLSAVDAPDDSWGAPYRLYASPDGSLLLGADSTVVAWDSQSLRLLGVFNPEADPLERFSHVGWSNDSSLFWAFLPNRERTSLDPGAGRIYVFSALELESKGLVPYRIIDLDSSAGLVEGTWIANDFERLLACGINASTFRPTIWEIDPQTGATIGSYALQYDPAPSSVPYNSLAVLEEERIYYAWGYQFVVLGSLDQLWDFHVLSTGYDSRVAVAPDRSLFVLSTRDFNTGSTAFLYEAGRTTPFESFGFDNSYGGSIPKGILSDLRGIYSEQYEYTNLGPLWDAHWARQIVLGTVSPEPTPFDLNSDAVIDISDHLIGRFLGQ